MMLHHARVRLFLAAALALLAPFVAQASDAGPEPDAEPPPSPPAPSAPLTQSAREELRAKLATAVVEVRRTLAPPPGITVPGGLHAVGAGWIVSAGRVATARTLVEGWPGGEADVIEVRGRDGTWRSAAVGLDDPEIGLAVLDVPGLPLAGPSPEPPTARIDVEAGRTLFSVPTPDAPLLTVVVRKRGTEGLSWYWIAEGPMLPPGTPLAAADGQVVALVGLRAVTDPPSRLNLLPPESLKKLFARSAHWRP
jgi:hypothetical protein